MNTRNIVRSITVAAAITLPVLSHAAQPIGFDGCVKAFVAMLTPKDAAAPKLRSARYVSDMTSAVYISEYLMKATNPLDNREVARAVCTVNARGAVVAIQPDITL